MKQFQSLVAVLCVLLVSAPGTYAQQKDTQQGTSQRDTTPRLEMERPHWYSPLVQKYEPKIVPPVNVSNTGRIESLLRAGQLYLSLQDTIALAVENNVDVEVQRYQFPLAQADLLRARAGSAIRGISTSTSAGSASAASPSLTSSTTGTSNFTSGGTTGGGTSGLSGSGAAGAGLSFDPALTGTLQWGHQSSPSQNTITTGTTAQILTNKLANFSLSQGFLTGATASLSYNNSLSFSNAILNNYNPFTVSSLDLQITQPLLQGFGIAINNRAIRIAKNNLQVADLVFQQQVINTVANVIQLYWNLVSFNEDVDVKTQALALAKKLYSDNQKQVEIGTLAPIEIVRAEAEVASREQDLLTAQTTVLQQETILKSALSRNGVASPAIADARIVPTDPIRIPEKEQVQPVQDLVEMALSSRPDLAQSRIQIDNSKISLTGTKNAMLPSINAFADLRNNALAGQLNTVAGANGLVPAHPFCGPTVTGPCADPFFIGGYGTVLGQLFGRNFPNYTVGAQLVIPLRNRSAQADVATAQLNLRQNELNVQKLINQIRVDVQNAVIAVSQAQARYQSAVKSRILQEQTLDAEQKKYALGSSTPFLVIQAQRDLATAKEAEVQAQAAYIVSKVQLDQATGQVLTHNNIEIEDAKRGQVSRPPSPLPVLEKNK
jgi:outer membrane protein TolC